MKTSNKNRNKKASKNRTSVNRFKEGQKVKYDGKQFTVKKAYVYHDKPFCLLENKSVKRLQVSANSLK
jgi:hypothetical protein